jgi:hypothetical protein
MQSPKLVGGGGIQPSEVGKTNVTELRERSLNTGSTEPRASQSSAAQAVAASASGRQFRHTLPKVVYVPSTRATEQSEVEVKLELEGKQKGEETSSLEEKSQPNEDSNPEYLEQFRPTREQIEAAWQTIVENNVRDSALSKVRSMAEKNEVESCKKAYFDNIATWLSAKDALAQIQKQQLDLQQQPITKDAMLPGDILLRKESPPQSAAHAMTLKFQTKQNLNGFEPNNGDHNIFHAALWIGDKSDRTMDTSKEIAEARGGLGTTNAMRVLAHSIQTGHYWVYRADPKYGLPQDTCEEIREFLTRSAASKEAGPLLGKVSSVFAELFSFMQERYSSTALSTSMRPDAKFSKLTRERVQDAIWLAANPSAMSHVGPTSDTKFFRDIRTLENAKDNLNKSVDRKGGDSCSTLIPRVLQTAALQIAAFNAIQKLIEEADGKSLDAAAREKIASKIAPTEDGDINDFFKELFANTLDEIGGLLANNAEGIAPKTIEHFCRDENNFNFVGVLSVTSDQVLREEMRFDKDGNAIEPTPPSVNAERNDCCTIV